MSGKQDTTNLPKCATFITHCSGTSSTTVFHYCDGFVKLLTFHSYNSILTITNHDCTKAVILLPCWEEMDPFKVTKLYLERVFPFVGLLRKVILDRDLRFTSRVFREICILLKVKQSIASAYHLQTNSQSKKTNLYVETALYIFSNFQQDNWSKLLPLV